MLQLLACLRHRGSRILAESYSRRSFTPSPSPSPVTPGLMASCSPRIGRRRPLPPKHLKMTEQATAVLVSGLKESSEIRLIPSATDISSPKPSTHQETDSDNKRKNVHFGIRKPYSVSLGGASRSEFEVKGLKYMMVPPSRHLNVTHCIAHINPRCTYSPHIPNLRSCSIHH